MSLWFKPVFFLSIILTANHIDTDAMLCRIQPIVGVITRFVSPTLVPSLGTVVWYHHCFKIQGENRFDCKKQKQVVLGTSLSLVNTLICSQPLTAFRLGRHINTTIVGQLNKHAQMVSPDKLYIVCFSFSDARGRSRFAFYLDNIPGKWFHNFNWAWRSI